MVLAQMLTYRLDVPQEGRASFLPSDARQAVELRVSVMPTTHGMRAAVRLPAELVARAQSSLESLGLPDETLKGLTRFAKADAAGMILLTGPAGSGKTTTIHALLRHIADTSPGLSIVALEDPVERDLPGVTQIEVSPFGELTYERALRSVLRQDPQVLMLGEIRDAATASLAAQVALSGHRLISTLHAATPGGAIARLVEMGVEPYQLTSAIFGVVSQRLLRRRIADGYRGRVPVAEFVPMDDAMRAAVLRKADAAELQRIAARREGHVDLRTGAMRLVAVGVTDEAEVRRVLGEPASADESE
jgi:type II secretory ATPase GspE/PulE/Tfp pilus assembly ATPase PilB-like protein